MIIRANKKEIKVKAIFGDSLKRGGKSYPALRFEFEKGATAEEVEALLSGNFEILNDNGEVVATHEGYNTLKGVSVVVGKITAEEQRIEELEAELAAVTEEKAVLTAEVATVTEEKAVLHAEVATLREQAAKFMAASEAVDTPEEVEAESNFEVKPDVEPVFGAEAAEEAEAETETV